MLKDNKVIGASLGKTINLGNYNSLRVSVWAQVEADVNDEQAWQELFEALEKRVDELVERNGGISEGQSEEIIEGEIEDIF